MPVSYTQHTLDKLEYLLELLGYKVRYGKGNFKTGSCVLENNKVIVVNKFSDIDTKINSFIQMILRIDTAEALLDDKQKEFLFLLKQTELKP
jgi:hypothetical protein